MGGEVCTATLQKMSTILAGKEGQESIKVTMEDGTVEEVHMHWENGPYRMRQDGSWGIHTWTYQMVKEHWTRFEKPWALMSQTEKECLVYQCAKINRTIRERDEPTYCRPGAKSKPIGVSKRIGGVLVR